MRALWDTRRGQCGGTLLLLCLPTLGPGWLVLLLLLLLFLLLLLLLLLTLLLLFLLLLLLPLPLLLLHRRWRWRGRHARNVSSRRGGGSCPNLARGSTMHTCCWRCCWRSRL